MDPPTNNKYKLNVNLILVWLLIISLIYDELSYQGQLLAALRIFGGNKHNNQRLGPKLPKLIVYK